MTIETLPYVGEIKVIPAEPLRLQTLFELERDIILGRIDHFRGNKTRAAMSLGITLKTIYNKLKKY